MDHLPNLIDMGKKKATRKNGPGFKKISAKENLFSPGKT